MGFPESLNRRWIFPVLLIAFLPGGLGAKSPFSSLSRRYSLSVEVGNWQPHSLNDEPRFNTFGAAGATPYFGVSFYIPVFQRIGLSVSSGYWSLKDVSRVESIHSLTLYPVTLCVKYWLISDDRLAAYASYGGGVYWGIENESEPFGRVWSLARGGWGIIVGAGFELGLTRWLGAGMNFEYRLTGFKEPLGGVDDFSGPKITAMFLVYF
ncbi:MAG TPA: hypothetical protein ENN03_01500 [bacterium]|nr:hypothetical protein [bacterium]